MSINPISKNFKTTRFNDVLKPEVVVTHVMHFYRKFLTKRIPAAIVYVTSDASRQQRPQRFKIHLKIFF